MDDKERAQLSEILAYASRRGIDIPADVTIQVVRQEVEDLLGKMAEATYKIKPDQLPIYTLTTPGAVPAPRRTGLWLSSVGWRAFPTTEPATTYVGGGGGVRSHSQLLQLDYAHAGHTGFAPSLPADIAGVLLNDGFGNLSWGPIGGGGDMLQAVYDVDADGVVDDSEALGGHDESYFATAVHTHALLHDPVTLDINADSLLSLSTQALGLDTQAAGRIFAGPAVGIAAVPTFRALVATDIPALAYEPVDVTIVRTGQINWIDLTDGGATTLHSHAADHAAVTLDTNADTILSLSTQALGLDTQTANRVWAGPTAGIAAVPTFRALVAGDIPALSYEPIDATIVRTGQANWIDLTDGGGTTLHTHAAPAGMGDVIDSGIVVGQLTKGITDSKHITAAAIIPPASNILTLTNAAASTLALNITAGKTLTLTSADDYALTIPATGTAALLNQANSFTLINPITTIAESWIGPSSTNGIYFKGGFVGVGTINPTSKINALYNNFDATTNPGFYFGGYQTTNSAVVPIFQIQSGWEPTRTANVFKVNTYQNNAGFNILANGNVGINVVPTRTLDITGTATIIQVERTDISSNPSGFIMRKKRVTSTVALADEIGGFQFDAYDGTNYISSAFFGTVVDDAVSTNVVPQALKFVTSSNGVGSAFERMRITSGGLVGIGIVAPLAKLHVKGTADDQVAILQANATQTNHVLEVQDSSNNIHTFLSVPGAASALENVFNETGSQYLDFRVESDNQVNAIFVDASSDTLQTNDIFITQGGRREKVTTVTTTYTALVTDELIVCNSTTAFTVTLPAATGGGQRYRILNINTGTVTVDGASSDTVKGAASQDLAQFDDLIITDYAVSAWG